MEKSEFVYVTYIRTTPEKLWQALIAPEFTKRYWMETWQESEWKVGASWCIKNPEKVNIISGEVVEIVPPKKLVLTWRSENEADMQAEGYSRVSYEIEKQGESVKLVIIHQINKRDSKLIQGVSFGWPLILASLKSFLETGKPLESTQKWKGSCGRS